MVPLPPWGSEVFCADVHGHRDRRDAAAPEADEDSPVIEALVAAAHAYRGGSA
jgi:hypothetical protein